MSETRITRTVYEYVYNIVVKNNATALTNGFKPFEGSAASQPAYQDSLGAALRLLAGASEAQFAANLAALEANELLYTGSATRRMCGGQGQPILFHTARRFCT